MRAAPYPVSWAIATAVAVVISVWNRTQLVIFRRDYWRWLFAPWKIVTFAIATTGMIAVAPFMRDSYWDHADAAFMSVLTFLTAPWAVATVFRALFRKGSPLETYVALCAALFSASWSFDLYQAVRLGFYPDIWLLNLIASSALYVMAGLFWNLDWSPERGAMFAFLDEHWPMRRKEPVFSRIVWPAALYMLAVSIAVLVPFMWDWR